MPPQPVLSKKERARQRAHQLYNERVREHEARAQSVVTSELKETIKKRDEEVARLKRVVGKLRGRIPGALEHWRIRPHQAAPEGLDERYPLRTRQRHLAELAEEMRLLTNSDPLKDRWLSKRLYAKFGHSSVEEADEKQRGEAISEAQDCVWQAMKEALAALKQTSGRLDNHRRAARQALLAVVSSKIPARLRSAAAADLGIRARDLKQHGDVLEELLDGRRDHWFELRAKKRMRGRFAETPVADLEAASAHWDATSVPSADKNKLRKNPEDKDDSHLEHNNYEHVREKKDEFVGSMRIAQQAKWQAEGPAVLEGCSVGDVVVTSLYKRSSEKGQRILLLELESTDAVAWRDVPLAEQPDLESMYGGFVGEGDLFVRGAVVEKVGTSKRDLELAGRAAWAPVAAIRSKLEASCARGGGEAAPRSWRLGERTDWGDFEASAQLFTMSMGIFIGCRPYYVRPGTRETSLCVYHLRWDFMVEAMRRYEKRHGGLPEQQAAGAAAAGGGNGNGGGGAGGAAEAKQDAVREALKTPSAARASSTCEGVAAPSNTKYSEPDCLDGKCSSCKDGAKFKSFLAGTVLEAAAAVPQVVDGGDGEGMDDGDDAGGADQLRMMRTWRKKMEKKRKNQTRISRKTKHSSPTTSG